jgi:hypothetical protein
MKIVRVINSPEFGEQRVMECEARDLTKEQIDELVRFMTHEPPAIDDLPQIAGDPDAQDRKH